MRVLIPWLWLQWRKRRRQVPLLLDLQQLELQPRRLVSSHSKMNS